MDSQIALLLGQDGLTSGAIYALLALSLVLVFSITRALAPTSNFGIFVDTIEFKFDRLATRLRELAFLNPGLIIDLEDERPESAKKETA